MFGPITHIINCSERKKSWKGQCKKILSGEFRNWNILSCWPWYCYCSMIFSNNFINNIFNLFLNINIGIMQKDTSIGRSRNFAWVSLIWSWNFIRTLVIVGVKINSFYIGEFSFNR